MSDELAATLLTPSLQAKLERLQLVTRRPRPGALQGDRRSTRRGANVEIADYRPYSAGDDLRQVDWNAFARLDRFFLKLYVEEEDTVVHVLVDHSRSMGWGSPSKLSFAAGVAAALGYVTLARLDWLRITPYADVAEPAPRLRRGKSASREALGGLDGLVAAGGTSLGHAMARVVAAANRPGPMIVLSDLYDQSWRDGVGRAAAARFDVTVVHVLSPGEIEPGFGGDLQLVDDETGEVVEASVDGDTLAQYRGALEKWRAENARWCVTRSVAYVPAVSDQSVEDFVLNDLRRHRVVAPRAGR